MSDRFPVIVGLATALASASAFAGDPVAPLQAVVRDVNDKQIVAFYTAEGGACDAATVEGGRGARLTFTCEAGASMMRVDQQSTGKQIASR
jgi:hypothetical protein